MPHHLSRPSRFVQSCLLGVAMIALLGCETNQATGDRQFTALMPARQEASIGASEHQKILKAYNGVYDNPRLQAYVTELGQRVAKHGERQDVKYTFTLLNSPVINAFAIPGGYVYVTRGLVAAANSEAELAAVLAHEVGHITGRHSAERYSTAAVTSIGTTVLGAVVGNPNITRVVNQGAGLWLNAYGRDQENEADGLGMRYMVAGGYDPAAMPAFLYTLQQMDAVAARSTGKKAPPEFLSTHPLTANRIQKTQQAAAAAPKNDQITNRDRHLDLINGMVYGDGVDAGFVRNGEFIHPPLGFAYKIPAGFRTSNQPKQVVSEGAGGALFIFDMAGRPAGQDVTDYLQTTWTKGKLPASARIERTRVNGMDAAMVKIGDMVDGKPAEVRLVAINWAPDRVARFQIIIPSGVSPQSQLAMKDSLYSLRRLRDGEKDVQPNRIRIITAKAGDTVEGVSRDFATDMPKADLFRALNGMSPTAQPVAGRRYKMLTAY